MSNINYSKTYTYYIIYETKCLVNQKTYIGCHCTDDINDGYLGSGKWLKRAINKYGQNNFERTILFYFDNPHTMFDKEKELVNEDYINTKNTYNLVVGGTGGFKIQDVDEWKKKLKVSSAKRSNKQPMLGKTHSEESKQKISNTNKGRPAWNKGLPGTWIGRTHSEESKQKISKNRKGLTAGENNPMYGKSAVKGRKWYNNGTQTFYLFPDDPLTENLHLGRKLN